MVRVSVSQKSTIALYIKLWGRAFPFKIPAERPVIYFFLLCFTGRCVFSVFVVVDGSDLTFLNLIIGVI